MIKELTLAKLLKLMRECKKLRGFVKIGDMEFDFRDQSQTETVTRPQARGSAKKARDIEEKADLQGQHDLVHDLVETLHVEDPAAYEAMLIRGELGEEKNH